VLLKNAAAAKRWKILQALILVEELRQEKLRDPG
jgi:hypothetical protein